MYFLRRGVTCITSVWAVVCKSGLTLHDFRRTTDQIGCDMSRRVIAGNRGK